MTEMLPNQLQATDDVYSGRRFTVGLLTGGDDRSYAHGLAIALANAGTMVDFIGSDALDGDELRKHDCIRFLNLRGDQTESASFFRKVIRLARYYLRLIGYSLTSKAEIFHILWNNKFELFDRTMLMMFYRMCGKKIVMTVHNVNAAKRDGGDNWLNRWSLGVQYRLCSHLFVHTVKMRDELIGDFEISPSSISVIPFGINDTSPRTKMTELEARHALDLEPEQLVLLFFGQIAPYKGLKYLVEAMPAIADTFPDVRLVIAGKVKRGSDEYWRDIEQALKTIEPSQRVVTRIEHIPDEDIEVYFKAADALVIPYVKIFQSGLPFLAYSFGLPVLATNVGSLAEEISPGENGEICAPCDVEALTAMVTRYARSDLRRDLAKRRADIAANARDRYSWTKVEEITRSAYRDVSGGVGGGPSLTERPGVRSQ